MVLNEFLCLIISISISLNYILKHIFIRLKGAQCIQLTSNNAYCKCSVGFTGQRCETSINPATPTTITATTTIPLLVDACATGLVFCQNGKANFLLSLKYFKYKYE
jgi:hypothetical protein